MSDEKMATAQKRSDLHWYRSGQIGLSGKALELYRTLDNQFVDWASRMGAEEYLFPPFLPAVELARLDYFRSFPHLVTFPITLDAQEENLARFAEAEPLSAAGAVQLTTTAPVTDVLTPAACYHFYVNFQGQHLDAPLYLTTRGNCFRREVTYTPLERQWAFSMREIVCLGTAEEVKRFLDFYKSLLTQYFSSIQLYIEWKPANDPFFRPLQNPKYLLQRLEPVKTEMIFQNRLAIGSINFHQNYFGETFGISRNGRPSFSGCVAFGLERWLAVWFEQFEGKLQERGAR